MSTGKDGTILMTATGSWLHLPQERLEREYDLDLIVTAPSVVYKVITTKDEELMVDTPSKLPSPSERKSLLEPYCKLEMIAPTEFTGRSASLSVFVV